MPLLELQNHRWFIVTPVVLTDVFVSTRLHVFGAAGTLRTDSYVHILNCDCVQRAPPG